VYIGRDTEDCPECAGWPVEKRKDLLRLATREVAEKPSITESDLSAAEKVLLAEWDMDGKKKLAIRDIVAPKIPEFTVRAAGATSIDVTKPGVDKAYGMQKLMKAVHITKEEILYMGDKIIPGGNDYAVEEMGIDCIAVRNWEDTAYAVEGIVRVS
jgi:HAD superfamily hydrolase (TIGR01484 family)